MFFTTVNILLHNYTVSDIKNITYVEPQVSLHWPHQKCLAIDLTTSLQHSSPKAEPRDSQYCHRLKAEDNIEVTPEAPASRLSILPEAAGGGPY